MDKVLLISALSLWVSLPIYWSTDSKWALRAAHLAIGVMFGTVAALILFMALWHIFH